MNRILTAITLIMVTALLAISLCILGLPDNYLEELVHEKKASIRCTFQPHLLGCGDPSYN